MDDIVGADECARFDAAIVNRWGKPGVRRFGNAGSTFDVSGNLFYRGTPVGSIEGAGHITLGQSLLTVGFLNSSTVMSGVISDDSNPNVGYLADGRLTKQGIGTLTLSRADTYSGVTTIDGGTLAINGSITGDVQVNGGTTLKGSGTIGGNVNVAPGGVVDRSVWKQQHQLNRIVVRCCRVELRPDAYRAR